MTASRKGLPYVIKSQQSERPLQSRRTPSARKSLLRRPYPCHRWEMGEGGCFPEEEIHLEYSAPFCCPIFKGSQVGTPNFSSLLLTSSFQIRGRGGANFPHVKRRRRVGSKEALPSLPWAIKISSPRCLLAAVICLAGGLHSSRRAKNISGMSPLLLGGQKNLDIFSFT